MFFPYSANLTCESIGCELLLKSLQGWTNLMFEREIQGSVGLAELQHWLGESNNSKIS